MKKKSQPGLWSDVSVLIVIVLAIMAFVRGVWQSWLLIGTFAIWCAFAVKWHLLPWLVQKQAREEALELERRYQQRLAQQYPRFSENELSDSASVVLLRHVSHRISVYLQTSYPEATWEWCCPDPEHVIVNGGTGRIALHGVPDYNYAEVILDQNARISCQLLKIVPLDDAPQPGAEQAPPTSAPRKEVDPQVWYERHGKTILSNLMADLGSRGHKSLTILEDGNVAIKQADKTLKKPAFQNIPGRTYWQRLVKVLERDGIASKITDAGLVLTW